MTLPEDFGEVYQPEDQEHIDSLWAEIEAKGLVPWLEEVSIDVAETSKGERLFRVVCEAVASLAKERNALYSQMKSIGVTPYLDRMQKLASAIDKLRDALLTSERQLESAADEIERLRAKVEQRDKLIAVYTDWKPGVGLIEPQKPFHGGCCCCQTCGRSHDECVCEHNAIEIELMEGVE